MFASRSRRKDPFLEWKVGLFSVAAVVGLGGIYLEDRRLTLVAAVLLAAAMLLRFKHERPDEGDDDSDVSAPEQGPTES